jgi:hypothetical protein
LPIAPGIYPERISTSFIFIFAFIPIDSSLYYGL